MSALTKLSPKQPIAKQQGFTLIELVIVLALIGISSVISLRFISDMAHSQVASAERAQALAGARFAMERLRRELSVAYSPSVRITNNAANEPGRCVYFVPVIAAGSYKGEAAQGLAHFIWPARLQDAPLEHAFMAISSPSSSALTANAWQSYPQLDTASSLNMARIENIAPSTEYSFNQLFNEAEPSPFIFDSTKLRYTLLKPEQVRFCLQGEQLVRQVKGAGNWSTDSLMLNGIMPSEIFANYNASLQLLTLDLIINSRDGDLALSSQLQVNYAP